MIINRVSGSFVLLSHSCVFFFSERVPDKKKREQGEMRGFASIVPARGLLSIFNAKKVFREVSRWF